jgi:hypothetical protein
MGMLPLPKVEAPQQPQLALPAPPTDTPLTMREFAMIMMQQGKARPGYQNLHEDPYNENEPMDDRYANLRPSSRIEEVEADVLKEAGATDEQIKIYQEQIQQQKASVSTTNDQKLASVGIDPEIVKKIKAAKAAGTLQGNRNIKPYGPYMNDPNFIASYNAGRALWLSQEPSERKTPKRPENFEFLAENEDPWSGVDASQAEQLSLLQRIVEGEDSNERKREELKLIKEQTKEIDQTIKALKKKGGIKDDTPPKDIFYDAPEDNEDEIRKLRERLVETGWRKDPKIKANETLNRILKGPNARKELRDLKEDERIKKIDEDIREIRKQNKASSIIANARKAQLEARQKKRDKEQEEQAGKVITKAAQRYRANKEKKALVQKLKADLEAEIAKLQEEFQAGSPQPKQPSAKSKAVSKAMASIKDFWKADMTKDEARQARKDAREAKNDALKKTEDNLAAKTKLLKDKRKQLEALGK